MFWNSRVLWWFRILGAVLRHLNLLHVFDTSSCLGELRSQSTLKSPFKAAYIWSRTPKCYCLECIWKSPGFYRQLRILTRTFESNMPFFQYGGQLCNFVQEVIMLIVIGFPAYKFEYSVNLPLLDLLKQLASKDIKKSTICLFN